MRTLAHTVVSCLLALLLSTAFAVEPEAGKMVKIQPASTKEAPRLSYWLYLPEEYTTTKDPLPLLVFLHGYGERGDDLDRAAKHGPPKLIRNGKQMPFIMIAPQCPNDGPSPKHVKPGKKAGTYFWWRDASVDLVHDIIEHETQRLGRVDASRIYLTGLSMGGMGTYQLAVRHPDTFAACAPICGLYAGEADVGAAKIKHIPFWAFHGDHDKAVPLNAHQPMIDALKEAGADVTFTVYPKVGHDSWTRTYDDPKLYEWFLKQRKK